MVLVDLNAKLIVPRKRPKSSLGIRGFGHSPSRLSSVMVFFASLSAAESKLLPDSRNVCSGFTRGWINSSQDWLESLTAVTDEKHRVGGLQ